MSNIVKFNEQRLPNSIKSGGFNIGVNSTPTDLTGFYDGISPIIGGYTIYVNKAENGPSIYAPKNDSELVTIVQKLGGSVSTAADALVWINSQSNMTVVSSNYPSIVTDGLVLNLDAGFVSSYPKTGTTWRDLSGTYNILLMSQRFNTSPWIKLGSPNVTVQENAGVAPDGTNTASLMTSNSTGSFGVRQSVGTKINPSLTYTFSVWMRSDTSVTINMDISDKLSISHTVTSIWNRYIITTQGNTNYSNELQFVDIVFGSNQSGATVYLWGSQLVEGTIPLTYQPVESNVTKNGTLINGVGFSDGGMAFDGINDYVQLSDRNLNTEFQYYNPFTIEVFTKITENTNNGYLITNRASIDGNRTLYTGWGLQQTSGFLLGFIGGYPSNSFDWRNVNISTTKFANDVFEKWTHIVWTNGGTLNDGKIYINGVDSTNQSFDNNTPPYIINYNGTHKITLGMSPADGNPGSHYLSGNISFARIYNKNLSQQEILQNYYASLQRFIPTDGLVLSLDAQNTNLYATSPTTAYDISGNDNNGTLVNGTQYVGDGDGSWSFDGVDDIIQFQTEYNLSNWTYSVVYNVSFFPNLLTNTLLTLQNNVGIITQSFGVFAGLYRIILDNQNNLYLPTFGIYKYQDIIRAYAMKINNDGSLNELNFNYTQFSAISTRNILIKSDNSVGFIAGTNLDTLAKFNTTTGQRTSSLGINTTLNNTVLFLDEINNHVYLGGDFTTINGVSYSRLARFDMDTLIVDNTFDTSNGFNGTVFDAKMNSDGKIYVVGSFTTYKGSSYNRIIRLNNNGTIDTSFNIGTGLNTVDDSVRIILDSNEKPIISGGFTSYNGTSCNRIVRLNLDGTIDNTFVIGIGFSSFVSDMVFDSNNLKIYCVGGFLSYNGTAVNRIARLNINGTIDTTFNIGTGFNGTMSSIAVQSDGKIIVGVGDININRTFTRTYNTTNQFSSLIRLNYNGSVDNTFNSGLGFTEGTYRNQLFLGYRNTSGSQLNFIALGHYPGNSNRLSLSFFQDYYNNKFHLMTITKDSDNLWRVYEDGVLRNTLTPPAGSDLSLKFQKITGRDLQSNIQIYNRALTQSEITTIYNATKSRYGIQ